MERRPDVEFLGIEIRLVKAVEQHKPRRPGLPQPECKMRQSAEIRRELDGDRNGHRSGDQLENIDYFRLGLL